MQNTSIKYSLYNTSSGDTAATSGLIPPEDTVIIVPLRDFAPRILLHKPENLAGSLIYTIIFLIIFAVIRLRGKNLFSLLMNVVAKKKKYEIVLNEGITQNLVYYFTRYFSLFQSYPSLSHI